jgi:hypothetical protein
VKQANNSFGRIGLLDLGQGGEGTLSKATPEEIKQHDEE